MGIPLSNPRRWQFAAGVVVLACVYLFLAAKEFAASVFASREELPKLELAVRLSPGNADYRHRLGRYFEFVAGDPQSAIDSLRGAVKLNPHDARYWFDLAGAYQVTGDTSGQRMALDRALQAEPTAPDVAWEAANFFLIDGEIDRALREFHVVIENDISLVDPALRACWRVRPDADALLHDVVPARPDTLIAFSNLLRSKQEVDGSIKTWDRLAQLHQKFENRYLYDYVRYLLLEVRRPEAAMSAWEENADALGLSAYMPTEDNLIVNGDFSLDILNGGFDWTYSNRNGVRPLLDPSAFRQGHRSLSLTFEGPGGPQIVLRDAYTGAPLFASEPLNDADFWKEVHSKVTTPKSTNLILLSIERFPAGSPIRGKLWLDDFELSPDDSSDDSPDQSPGNSKGNK